MATNPTLSPNEKSPAMPVPTLDESLAQLEEALDLFVSRQADDEAGITTPLATTSPLAKLQEATLMNTPDPVEKEEAVIQTLGDLPKKIIIPTVEDVPQWASNDMVAVPEEDEDMPKRRFPLFTDAQKRMLLLALGLLAFFAVIGFLIWYKQKSEEEKQAFIKRESALYAQPIPSAIPDTPVVEASLPPTDAPTEMTSDDKLLTDSVSQILMAYNPTAIGTRYKIAVKDGVVTLTGEAQTQMEKDGVANVLRPLQGVNKIVNNLVVKGLLAVGPGGAPLPSGSFNGPVMYPKVNEVEARKLDDAYLRELQESTRRANEEAKKINAQNTQLKAQPVTEDTTKLQAADSERRKQSQATVNDENNALRQQSEERIKREKEEYERRLEEQRRTEAARQQRAEQARATNDLRAGTVSWSGVVKGVEDIVINGSSSEVRHVSGAAASNARASFSAPVPNAPISVRLVASNGKAPIRIVQQPSAANGFTTIVRVGDGDKADGKPHSFSLRWSAQ